MIRSDQGNERMLEKVVKYAVYTAFLLLGHAFWKESIEDRGKLLGSNILNCCLKITMADLHEKGLKMREWNFKELSSS